MNAGLIVTYAQHTMGCFRGLACSPDVADADCGLDCVLVDNGFLGDAFLAELADIGRADFLVNVSTLSWFLGPSVVVGLVLVDTKSCCG